MHLQLFHVDYFKILSKAPSSRPKGIISYKSNKSRHVYRDALIVFTSIEKSDSSQSIQKGKDEILRIYANLNNMTAKGCNKIVVIPYSHQRNIETDSQLAVKYLTELYDSVVEEIKIGCVFFGDFGFANKWSMSVKSHRLSCLYRGF